MTTLSKIKGLRSGCAEHDPLASKRGGMRNVFPFKPQISVEYARFSLSVKKKMTTWTVQIVSSGGKSNLKMPLVLIIL
jgi:hypothetical protein